MKLAAKRESRFRRVMRKIGEFMSSVFLGLIYLILWMPVGLLSRLLADWLVSKPPRESAWHPRPKRLDSPEHLKEPF
jgi:hypothetical protein